MRKLKQATIWRPKQFDLLDVETIVTGAIPRQNPLSGIYFLIDRNQIVYVGKSKNFHSRFVDHDAGDKVWDRFYFLECNPADLKDLEYAYINFYCPKYNKDKLFSDPTGSRNLYTVVPAESKG